MIRVETFEFEVHENIKSKLVQKMHRAGEIGRQVAYKNSRVDTSDMRNSTEFEVEFQGGLLTLMLGQGNRQVDYAKYQELGTKHFEGTHHVKKGLLSAVRVMKLK